MGGVYKSSQRQVGEKKEKGPEDATYEDDNDEELKELVGYITEFLELAEEFEDW